MENPLNTSLEVRVSKAFDNHFPPPERWRERSEVFTLSKPRMKISIIKDISILRFYGYIKDTLMDILKNNIGRLKIVKNS